MDYFFIIYLTELRVNSYCGELLQIGNEDWDFRKNVNWTEVIHNKNSNEEDDDDELNGPRTEALRHNEMNFYQVKSVKIIKAAKNETPTATPQANFTDMKLSRQLEKEKEKDKAKNQVYSQVI